MRHKGPNVTQNIFLMTLNISQPIGGSNMTIASAKEEYRKLFKKLVFASKLEAPQIKIKIAELESQYSKIDLEWNLNSQKKNRTPSTHSDD